MLAGVLHAGSLNGMHPGLPHRFLSMLAGVLPFGAEAAFPTACESAVRPPGKSATSRSAYAFFCFSTSSGCCSRCTEELFVDIPTSLHAAAAALLYAQVPAVPWLGAHASTPQLALPTVLQQGMQAGYMERTFFSRL